jgi:hypothetical protein
MGGMAFIKFYRLHWYHVGGVLFIALTYFMGFWGDHFSQIQVILMYSFMAMLLHQFEEYGMPSGFPGIANVLLMGEKQAPDRYPPNANQVLISNVFLTYPFYVLPIACQLARTDADSRHWPGRYADRRLSHLQGSIREHPRTPRDDGELSITIAQLNGGGST